jgi:hypothetical protein
VKKNDKDLRLFSFEEYKPMKIESDTLSIEEGIDREAKFYIEYDFEEKDWRKEEEPFPGPI